MYSSLIQHTHISINLHLKTAIKYQRQGQPQSNFLLGLGLGRFLCSNFVVEVLIRSSSDLLNVCLALSKIYNQQQRFPWFRDPGSVRWMVGLDLNGLFQPDWFYDSRIVLCFFTTICQLRNPSAWVTRASAVACVSVTALRVFTPGLL